MLIFYASPRGRRDTGKRGSRQSPMIETELKNECNSAFDFSHGHPSVSATFLTRCGVENVMADNLLIKVGFWCDRIIMRLKPA